MSFLKLFHRQHSQRDGTSDAVSQDKALAMQRLSQSVNTRIDASGRSADQRISGSVDQQTQRSGEPISRTSIREYSMRFTR